MNNGKFDPYHIKKGLDFCKKHDVQARYHSLLTQEQIKQLQGKSKEEIIEQLRAYVSETIDFINGYNNENKLSDGMPVINSVDIFNELINLKKDKTTNNGYYNVWEQLGLTVTDLVDIFAPAIGKKPEGIEYIYNEAFVETEEKRKVQLELARRIKQQAPELIDIFGTQMHITTEFKESTIERTFLDLKEFSEETGIEIAITEFDMHMPGQIIDSLKKAGKTTSEIAEYAMYRKLTQLSKISEIAKKVGIKFTEISYGSMTDSMDHNKKRNERTTLYGGLFGSVLAPKAVKEIVEYKPQIKMPEYTSDVLGYLGMLNAMQETQPMITPNEYPGKLEEKPKQFVKKQQNTLVEDNLQSDAGYANFPQILMLTLILIAVLYILLM